MQEEITGFMTTEHKRNVVTETTYRYVLCKFCRQPEAVVKFGVTPKGRQRYLCRECRRTFVDNRAPEGMRFPTEVIASALNQFYESASLNKIRRQLLLTYGVAPDHTNIYRWVARYSKAAAKALATVPIKAGPTWVADETVLKLKSGGGENVWFWDVIDEKTRFLLASHISPTRYTQDARTLMERAARRAGKAPKAIITDKLRSYLGGVEDVFGADTKHVQSGPFELQTSSRSIERFHGTLKDRTKVMRALANRDTAKVVLDGWLTHYNFFRPHSGLGGKTPSEAAGARAPFKSWLDVVASQRR